MQSPQELVTITNVTRPITREPQTIQFKSPARKLFVISTGASVHLNFCNASVSDEDFILPQAVPLHLNMTDMMDLSSHWTQLSFAGIDETSGALNVIAYS